MLGCRQPPSHSVSFFMPPGCLFALGEEIKNIPNQNIQCTFPRENTYITVSGLLIEALSTFSGCVLPPRVEGSSFPVHSTSLARHIALVKSCSTQWDKYPP